MATGLTDTSESFMDSVHLLSWDQTALRKLNRHKRRHRSPFLIAGITEYGRQDRCKPLP